MQGEWFNGSTAADEQRGQVLQALRCATPFDLVVVGGGATGLGIALDAALRGLRVALVERGDFGQGTSSRSTKLVHGGVRYLAQGNFALVHEALRERGNLLANAPHIVQPLGFVMPAYRAWQIPFYGTGLAAYDLLAGKAGIRRTRVMGPAKVRKLLPTVRPEGLLGGIAYWDGQFDDARLAVALARTAQLHGAVLANHCEVTGLVREGGRAAGVLATDRETGASFRIGANCVVNATGVWAEDLMSRSSAAGQQPLVVPSQGIHLSLDASFLPGDSALFWPRTSDGRVLFAVPWLGKTIIGTTDSRADAIVQEPRPLPGEIDYLLQECARFLAKPPTRADILSAWVGLRPLVNPQAGGGQDTKSISREHTVLTGNDGLVTVTGGKWTTYRAMAQDVLDRCVAAGSVPERGPCVTARTRLVGASGPGSERPLTRQRGEHSYGTEAGMLRTLPGADRWLAPGLSEAMVRFAVRFEFARTVEDVLARRCRLLFLDARAAQACGAEVAEVVRSETAGPVRLEEFEQLARAYASPCA